MNLKTTFFIFLLLCGSLVQGQGAFSTCETPPDQDFGTYEEISYGASLTYQCITYTGADAYVGIGDKIDQAITTSPIFSGSALVVGGNNPGGYAAFKSSSQNNFKLVSFIGEFYGHSNGNSSEAYQIMGYDNGNQVVRVDNFKVTTSGSYGSGDAAVVWARENFNEYGSNSGKLSFGSGWANIDEIRFYPTDPSPNNWVYIGLDNIDFEAAVENSNTTPTLSTTPPSGITATTVTLGGTVTDTGGAAVSEKGVVISTTGTPTTSDVKIRMGSGPGNFSTEVAGLSPKTEYFVRAYATNSLGTSYGSEERFTTPAKDQERCIPTYSITGGSWRISKIALPENNYSYSINDPSKTDYSSEVISVKAEIPYTFQVTTTGWTGVGVAADFNGDGDFGDSDEILAPAVYEVGNTHTYQFTINIPANVALGSYRMRLWNEGGNAQGEGTGPCGNFTYGSFADFSLAVIPTTPPAEPLNTEVSQKDVSCNGGANGSIDLTVAGGTAPYTYNWGEGVTTEDRSNLSAGTYEVTVTDADGKTASETVNISQPEPFKATVSFSQISCNGGDDGTATVSATGGTAPYTYLWYHSGETEATVTGLSAGTYSVRVADANGCSVSAGGILADPAPLVATETSVMDVSCYGGSNGSASITVGGGTGSYQYSWAPYGGTKALATGLSAGTYTVTVTDESGCSLSRSLTIDEAPPIQITATQTNVTCNGSTNGSIDLSVSGGTPPYTYDWGGGTSTEDRTGLSSGDYTVHLTDANGCTATRNFAITQPVAVVADAPADVEACESYILTPLNTGNYFTAPDGQGTALFAGDEITESQTVYVFAEVEGCTDENSFVIKVSENELKKVVFEGGKFIYDGTAHSIFVTGLPEGSKVTYSNNNQTEAGTYTVTARLSSANAICPDIELTAELVIDKAPTVISAKTLQSHTYDGTVKKVTASLNHSEAALTFTPQQAYTDAGTYTVTVASAETENYKAASKEVSLVIEKAEITGVTFESKTFTYNASEHSIFVNGLPEGAEVSYTGNGKTQAGTYEVTATVRQENYNDLVLTADLTIEKAKAVITADAVQSFIYDGTVKNVSASLNHSETPLTYSPQQGYTDAGTYTVTVASAETENYLSASKEVTLVIEKAEITGVGFDNETFTYNGSEHSIFVSGLPEGATVSYTENGKTGAGTYEVTATVSQENYNDLVLTADLTIEKAAAVITADAVQNFTYDGTVKKVTASLNHSETALTYAPQQGYTNAGTYTVSVASAETENYLSASKEVTLVIEKAEIIGVTFYDQTFTYNGSEHSIFVSGLPEGAEVSYVHNAQTNAGMYEVTATVSRENYNDLIVTADLIIEKAEAVITAGAIQSFIYDGTYNGVTASLNHSETALTYAPQQAYTDAGTYTVTVASAETENYLSVSREVTLVIEKAEITGVSFDNQTFTYNGNGHNIYVSGLPEGASVRYENNGQIDAGTYTVTATVSKTNYHEKVFIAELTINKAVQHIDFSVLSERDLETDSDFLMGATASSGLPLTYTYTYDSQTPAATVNEEGYVSLHHAGEITITASQAGDSNYEPAESVIRTLKVTSSTAEVETITINGQEYSDPEMEIYYLLDCGNTATEVSVNLQVNPLATPDQGTAFSIATPVAGIYSQKLQVTSPDGSVTVTYTITVEKRFNFEAIVEQKFNNVLLVNNNPATNGGYEFVSYEWFRNGNPIGTGQYISAGDNADDRIGSTDEYSVKMTTSDGQVLQTCGTTVQAKSSLRLILAPSPARAGEQVQLVADFPKEELKGMQIEIHSLNGTRVKQLQSDQKLTTFTLPYFMHPGVYILTCKTKTGQKSLQFMVK